MATRMTEMFADGEGMNQAEIPAEQAEQFGQLANPEVLLDQPELDKILDTFPAEMLPFANEMVDTIRDVFSDALTTTFLAAAIIMVTGVIVALFVRAIPLVSAQDSNQQEQKKAE